MFDRIIAFFFGPTKPSTASSNSVDESVVSGVAFSEQSGETVPTGMFEIGLALERLKAANPNLTDADLGKKIGQSEDYVHKAFKALEQVRSRS